MTRYIDVEGFDINKPYHYVTTKAVTFRHNDLTVVLSAWHHRYNGAYRDLKKDINEYEALSVGRVG